MTQLSKEQIDAVAEWILSLKSHQVVFIKERVADQFVKDFSPKSVPDKWWIKLDKNHPHYGEFKTWWADNFCWSEPLAGEYFCYNHPTGHKFIKFRLIADDDVGISINLDQWREWYGEKRAEEILDSHKEETKKSHKKNFNDFLVHGETSLPKITDLSNTKIWIGENPELSEKIQKRAFELGFTWYGDTSVSRTETYALYFSNRCISCNRTHSLDREIISFAENSKKQVFPEQILESEPKKIIDDPLGGRMIECDSKIKGRTMTVEKPKVYILQKDTIGQCGGISVVIPMRTKFSQLEDHYIQPIGKWSFPKDFVENNPDWFLPEEEKEAYFSVRSAGCNVIEITKLTLEPWNDTLNRIIKADFLHTPKH